MRPLILFLALLVSFSTAEAAQSLTLNGSTQYAVRTVTNSSPFTAVASWRFEMRLTNIASGGGIYRIVDNEHFYIQLNSTTGVLGVFSWDGEITDTTVDLGGFLSHLTDVTIRVQRDVANSRYTIEAWDSSGTTRFGAVAGAATSMVNRSFGNTNFYVGTRSIEQGGSTGAFYNGRIAFVRWYSTLIDYTTATKPILYTNTAQLFQYEFEGNLNDSSGNSQTLTGVGTPTYNTTPSINPIASAGVDSGGRIAGVTFALSGSNSAPGDVGPVTSYAWTRTAGSGTIASPSASATNITGIAAGQSTFQLEVSDGTNSATDSVDIGVVTIGNGCTDCVEFPDAVTELIIGPQLRYGSSSVDWSNFDVYAASTGDTVGNAYPVFPPYTDLTGTISVTNGSTTVTGSGTTFTTQLNSDSPGELAYYIQPKTTLSADVDTLVTTIPVASTTGFPTVNQLNLTYALSPHGIAGASEVVRCTGKTSNTFTGCTRGTDGYPAHTHSSGDLVVAGEAFLIPLTIHTIDSDTQLTLDAPFSGTTVSAARHSTSPLPTAATSNNNDGYWNYYDQALVQWRNYYVTGLTKYRTYARKITDSWVQSGAWNYGRGTDPEWQTGPRSVGLGGIILRAMDGRPELWDGIYRYTAYQYDNWVTQRIDYPGLYFGTRDPGYALLYAVWVANALPNSYTAYVNGFNAASTGSVVDGNTKRSTLLAAALNGAVYYFARLQRRDGSWRWELSNAATNGYGEQTWHASLMMHGMEDLMRTMDLPANSDYKANHNTEYNTMRNSFITFASHLFLEHYNTSVGADPPTTPLRFVQYALYDTDFRAFPSQNVFDPAPQSSGDVAGLRQNASTVPHLFGWAYAQSGLTQFRTWGNELMSANFGYGSGPNADAYGGLLAFYTRTVDPRTGVSDNRSAKEYDENYRTSGRYFGFRERALLTPANLAPFGNPGPDLTLTAGTTSVNLVGGGDDPEGSSVSCVWTKGFGTGGTIVNGTSCAGASATGLTNGFYWFQLEVSDGANKSFVWKNVTIGGTAPATALSVNAGANQSLSAGTTSTSLSGSATGGGSTRYYTWTILSGPAGASITNPRSTSATLTGLVNGGKYVVRLVATDNTVNIVPEPIASYDQLMVTVASGGAIQVCKWNTSPACAAVP